MEVKLTENAKQKIHEFINESDLSDPCFRIGLLAGGCNGFTYTFEIDFIDEDNDEVVRFSGYDIIIDYRAAPYLDGITVDYISTVAKSEFIVENPNFDSSCGCGRSTG